MNSRWNHFRRVLKFIYAQFGIKRGKGAVLALLLTPEELPLTDWSLRSTATLRAALTGEVDEIALRARALGCITALGYFVNDLNLDRLTIRIEQLASADDASNRVTSFDRKSRLELEPNMKVSEVRTASDLAIPGIAAMAGLEYNWTKSENEVHNFKGLAGSFGPVYFLVTLNGINDVWRWDEVLKVTALQAQKIIDNLGNTQT